MKTTFLIIAVILSIASTLPYAWGILQGRTKPNLVSWITWTLLTGVTTAALFSSHEYGAALFSGSVALQTASIVLLSLKYGFVKYTRFDVACQIGALVGIILWQLFDSPTVGILVAIIIDTIGALPTVRHAWKKPHEEVWLAYAIAVVGGLFVLASFEEYSWVTVPYAMYSISINALFACIILSRIKINVGLQPQLRSSD